MLSQAGKALAASDYLAAQQLFGRAVQLHPDDLDALQGLAVTLAVTGQHTKAIDVYERIIQLTADAPRSSRPATTPAASQHAATSDEINLVARYNLAVAFTRTRQTKEAEKVYLGLIEENPGFLAARFNLATIYQSQGRLEEAAKTWRDVLKDAQQLSAASAATAATSLGQALMDLQQPAQAIDAYAQATQFTPDDPSAWVNLTVAAQKAGSLGRALAAAQQALKINPNSDDLWYRLGNVLLDIHRASGSRNPLVRAVDAWQKSLEINPDQPQLRKLLQQYQQVVNRTTTVATNEAIKE